MRSTFLSRTLSLRFLGGTTGTVLAAIAAIVALHHSGSRPTAAHQVDFNRDIRPILNQSCTSCHGGVRQLNGVSFIYREEALGKGKSGRPTIVPGYPERSELIARVSSRDPEVRMPYHAPPLQPEQINLLRQWIKEGAQWEDYWSFVPPKPQPLPGIKNTAWPQQPLDRFILARLEKEGLHPSPEADKAALLRRVSFDLTGLPPTPAELSAFLADPSANAYEKQVDRLLASPHFGERWASMWLDLARYADSRGYERDLDRPSWPYRDWVIDAYNRNLPYDQFVIAQLAGDLLPGASLDDEVATSFQRQTATNDESGSDDEEFRMVAVLDRVSTTWSVLNGLTMACVQCHSHPYDPIRHAEYYKFAAFYDTSRDADLGDDAPNLAVPKDPARRNEAAQLQVRQRQLLQEIVAGGRSLVEHSRWTPLPITAGKLDRALGQERYLEELKQHQREGKQFYAYRVPQKTLEQLYTDAIAQVSSDLTKHTPPVPLTIANGAARAPASVPLQSVFELQTGPAPSAVTALRVEVPVADPDKARHTPEAGFKVDRIDAWIVPPSGPEQKVEFHWVPDSQDNEATLVRALQSGYAPQGSFAADSKLFETRWMVAIPDKPLLPAPGSHLRIQLTHTEDIDRKAAAVSRVRLYTSQDPQWTAWVGDQAQAAKLTELVDVQRRLAQIPSVLLPVMEEQAPYARRQMLEFERGNMLTKVGPALAPDVPGIFPKLPAHAPRNRLTMAKWFFSPGQPLTARVAVNRYWEQLFGVGIVETLEDFGSVGQLPSHPRLLDWLALHFQNDLHWDTKALLREMVTSATYRQSAAVSPELLTKDPRNRLLARGPRQRLTAEMVRDQTLVASGLLNPTQGGPPVMPPQPAGVWNIVADSDTWVDSKGADRYRRSIYTYWKRSAPYPSTSTFDAPDHVVSTARRIPTNTPLQALVTLNDPVYYEAAQALAKRMLKVGSERSADTAEVVQARLNFGAECVLSRELSPQEREAFVGFYAKARAGNDDLTVWTAAATALLNSDTALTR